MNESQTREFLEYLRDRLLYVSTIPQRSFRMDDPIEFARVLHEEVAEFLDEWPKGSDSTAILSRKAEAEPLVEE